MFNPSVARGGGSLREGGEKRTSSPSPVLLRGGEDRVGFPVLTPKTMRQDASTQGEGREKKTLLALHHHRQEKRRQAGSCRRTFEKKSPSFLFSFYIITKRPLANNAPRGLSKGKRTFYAEVSESWRGSAARRGVVPSLKEAARHLNACPPPCSCSFSCSFSAPPAAVDKRCDYWIRILGVCMMSAAAPSLGAGRVPWRASLYWQISGSVRVSGLCHVCLSFFFFYAKLRRCSVVSLPLSLSLTRSLTPSLSLPPSLSLSRSASCAHDRPAHHAW